MSRIHKFYIILRLFLRRHVNGRDLIYWKGENWFGTWMCENIEYFMCYRFATGKVVACAVN